MSVPSSSNAMSTLPVPIPSDGTFTVVKTITDGSFSSPNVSSIYSNYILSPSAIVGTESAPYMPIALPAYVSTLYQNIWNINNNLKDNISNASTDNREYPTSYAVQSYVQSQLSGTQIMSGSDPSNNQSSVHTTVSNTVIKTVLLSTANSGTYTNGSVNPAVQLVPVATYIMDTEANVTRNGATKTVVFADTAWLANGQLVFLSAGANSDFIIAGQRQNYYQFTFLGDFVTFIMVRNADNNGWNWLVTNYQSRFSQTIDVDAFSNV